MARKPNKADQKAQDAKNADLMHRLTDIGGAKGARVAADQIRRTQGNDAARKAMLDELSRRNRR